jgi:hypothetical protein
VRNLRIPADQVRWSFAARPNTEKGYSPSSVEGATRTSVIQYHPSSPILPPVVGARCPSPSYCSISTERNKPSDSIKQNKSRSTPLNSASSPEITTPRWVGPATLMTLPIAQHTETSFYQGIIAHDVTVSQGAPLQQPFTCQPSAPISRTAPMDITDSWMRHHIATSVILSARSTPIDSPRDSTPTRPGLPAEGSIT